MAANTFSPPVFFSSSDGKKEEQDSANETKISDFNESFRQPPTLSSISLKEFLSAQLLDKHTMKVRWEMQRKHFKISLRRAENCFPKTKATLNRMRVWHDSASILAFSWVLKELRHNLDKPLNMTQFIHTNCQKSYLFKKTLQQKLYLLQQASLTVR